MGVIEVALNKIKGTKNRTSIQIRHLNNLLLLPQEQFERLCELEVFKTTKSDISVISGHGLSHYAGEILAYRNISKFCGIDIIIKYNSRGQFVNVQHLSTGNDLVIAVDKKYNIPNKLLLECMNEYVITGGYGIEGIFDDFKKYHDNRGKCTLYKKTEEAKMVEESNILFGKVKYIPNKIYRHPYDHGSTEFYLNGKLFRFHVRVFNQATVIEGEQSSSYEDTIIRYGIRSGLFSGIYFYDREAVEIHNSFCI